MKKETYNLKNALADYAIEWAGKENVLLNSKDGGAYFCDFRENVFQKKMDERFVKMFMNGDGNELVSKASAVHSSSMLGFNFFHWIDKNYPLTINFGEMGINTYDTVYFEEKLVVLDGTRPANMDIILTNSKGDFLFIESKFMEYLKKDRFSISDTYKYKTDKYLTKEKQWKEFLSSLDYSETGQYWSGIKQEICHMIAINNWIDKKIPILNRYYDESEVRFINLVFSPDPKSFKKESEDFEKYKTLYEKLHEQLAQKDLIPKKVVMQFMTYSSLWKSFVTNKMPLKLEEFLKEHYMRFAAKEDKL